MSWTVTTISLTVRLIKDLCGSTSGREEHEAAVDRPEKLYHGRTSNYSRNRRTEKYVKEIPPFCPIHRLNQNILKQTFPYIHNIFILPTLPDSCLILYSHTQQTTFPSHSDYDLHDIHQKHCNKQSDLQT